MEIEEQQQKNEYFLKKEQREIELSAKQKNQKLKNFLRWVVYTAVFVLVIFGVFKLTTKKVGPVSGDYFKAQSREHIKPNDAHPAYNSNPPTGGWHYDTPAQTGIYDKELPDEQVIHNLEHGHIWITYKPDLAQDQIETLAKIAKNYGLRIIMAPRSANDSPIAVVAWEHIYKLDRVDKTNESQIRAFIDAYRNIAGPERNIPDSGFRDFRGKANAPSVAPMNKN